MMPIPYGHQSVSQPDIDAVTEALRSDWLTQGPAIPRFEKAVAEHCGAPHAAAASSATAALHLACLGLDLGPGDLLWTSPITFVASANCARYCGADVDFVDIDPHTCNLSVAELERKLDRARQAGRLPKIVVPVHFAGQSCEMRAIRELSARYGFKVLEDASHAVGGRYRDEPVGSCRYSDAAVFSFHPVKIITTGEGGMVLTRDSRLHERILRLRTHGITREPALLRDPSPGAWYYEQLELGFNYRMTDLQAALGLSQLGRIDEFVEARRKQAARYQESFAGLPLASLRQQPETSSSWHLYVIRLDAEAAGRSRRQVFDDLRGSGIGVNVHYIPVHLQPYYRALGFKAGDFPSSERYYAEAITLPLFPGLSRSDQDRVIDAVRAALR